MPGPMPSLRAHTPLLVITSAFSQVGLVPSNSASEMYAVAFPALKALVSVPHMDEDAFLQLIGFNNLQLLAALVANDTVSTVEGKVEFQSRAAQFFVEQLPPPPPLPPPPKGRGLLGK